MAFAKVEELCKVEKSVCWCVRSEDSEEWTGDDEASSRPRSTFGALAALARWPWEMASLRDSNCPARTASEHGSSREETVVESEARWKADRKQAGSWGVVDEAAHHQPALESPLVVPVLQERLFYGMHVLRNTISATENTPKRDNIWDDNNAEPWPSSQSCVQVILVQPCNGTLTRDKVVSSKMIFLARE